MQYTGVAAGYVARHGAGGTTGGAGGGQILTGEPYVYMAVRYLKNRKICVETYIFLIGIWHSVECILLLLLLPLSHAPAPRRVAMTR